MTSGQRRPDEDMLRERERERHLEIATGGMAENDFLEEPDTCEEWSDDINYVTDDVTDRPPETDD